ncbi:hypothetical protein NKH77_53780 [Streptomyces sp. M19]
MIVWDTGPYRDLTERRGEPVPAAQAVANGHVKVWLDGEKLSGGFALTRTGDDRGKERWILVKIADERADARRRPVSSQPESVRSGRTVEDLARGGRRVVGRSYASDGHPKIIGN